MPKYSTWTVGLAVSLFFLTPLFPLAIFGAIALFIIFLYDTIKVGAQRQRVRNLQQQWARYYQHQWALYYQQQR